MKKLILTSLVMLISISVYSQSANNSEEKKQSTSLKPVPAEEATFQGIVKPSALDIQSISSVPEPSTKDISREDTTYSKNEKDIKYAGNSDSSNYRSINKNKKPCAKAFEESDNVEKAEAILPDKKEKAEPAL